MSINKQIKAFKPYGVISIPSSKSYSHRYLISAFLANQKCDLNNINLCEDVKLTLKALKKLGGIFECNGTTISFIKRNAIEFGKPIEIECRDSASTLRFLLPLAVYLTGNVTFKCSERLLNRSISEYTKIFKNKLDFQQNENGINIKGKLDLSDLQVDSSESSQYVTGLLFLLAESESKFSIEQTGNQNSQNYIDMTLKSLEDFGFNINHKDNKFEFINFNNKQEAKHDIELDYSSFAYFAVLGALKGEITINNYYEGSIQGDKTIIDLLKHIGASININGDSISFTKSQLTPFEINISNCIDLGPILFVLAASIPGKSIIKGVDRLMIKESNRLNAMLEELSKDNIQYEINKDEVIIYGVSDSFNNELFFDSHNDHRIAMAVSIYAQIKNIDCVIKNYKCIKKSYPNFFNDLESLKTKVTLSIYNIKTLELYSDLIDTAILMTPRYSQVYEQRFNFDKAIKLCEERNIEPIISINKVFMEDELDNVEKFIKKYKNYKFLISDLGIARILEENHILSNAIYAPDTLVCNSNDLAMLNAFGFNAISMSNEVPIKDIIKANQETNADMMYQVFGRKIMFYSKRRLLELYKEHTNISFKNKDISLVEEKRSYHIPVVENENGFKCFRPYNISLVDQLKQLRFLKYAYVESLGLSKENLIAVLLAVNININDEQNFELDKEKLNIQEGFENVDSIYIKEKIIQWEK